jgi:hypothetical protein
MAKTEPHATQESTVAKLPKKKYSPPKLTEYGTVREMTNAIGQTGQLDGGSIGSRVKTNI